LERVGHGVTPKSVEASLSGARHRVKEGCSHVLVRGPTCCLEGFRVVQNHRAGPGAVDDDEKDSGRVLRVDSLNTAFMMPWSMAARTMCRTYSSVYWNRSPKIPYKSPSSVSPALRSISREVSRCKEGFLEQVFQTLFGIGRFLPVVVVPVLNGVI